MSLRLRLAAILAVAAFPLLWGFHELRDSLELSQLGQRIEDQLAGRYGRENGLDRLENEPEFWGGLERYFREFHPAWIYRSRRSRSPVRLPLLVRPEIWAYEADFSCKNIAAPEFPERLRSLLANRRSAMIELPKHKTLARSESQAGRRLSPREMALWFTLAHRRFLREIEEHPNPLPRVAFAMRFASEEQPTRYILVSGERRPGPPVSPLLGWLPVGLYLAVVLVVFVAAGPIVRRIRLLTEDVRFAAAQRYEEKLEVRGSDEIARLAKAFNEAGGEVRQHIEEVQRRERALRDFIANTTHDVMIPLTVLQGHLDRARKEAEARGQNPDAIHSALGESGYIASIVHNLSAVAKLEGANLELRRDRVDLSGIVERCVARHRPVAMTSGIAIEFATPGHAVEVLGDVTLIEQAISNVVHNAVRYGKNGDGHVAITLDARDEAFDLRIFDDGPGIPEDELPKLAERRFRGEEARTRDPNGSGLGLAIVRDVAERHGFELEFAKSEFGGLEVRLSGPLAGDDKATRDAGEASA